MKNLRGLAFLAVSFLLLMPVRIGAATYDFYETVDNSPTGTPSKVGPSVQLATGLDPNISRSGYTVVLESGDPAGNKSTWDLRISNFSDVLAFYYKDANGNPVSYYNQNAITTAIYGTLFSDPIPQYIYDAVSDPNHNNFAGRFYIEDSSGVTTDYSPRSTNTYIIHSDGAGPVPEPGTMMLLGSGLVGLVGYGRRRFKK